MFEAMVDEVGRDGVVPPEHGVAVNVRVDVREQPAATAAAAVAWLSEHGWDAETHDRGAVAAGYGRAAPADTSAGSVTAKRRSRGAGYGPSWARRMARGRKTR